ncbi:alpha/beta fold hydrolase [Rapidithrix thailandica]|uniref:Alpha/beta fold hydrolase n=1 Tax=Rapidithrix thailandica TaxID=413964 RepID=A0AAW9S0I0_9BACT
MKTAKNFRLPNFKLQNGQVVPELNLVYQTYGRLNAAKDNVIVYPTWFAGQHPDNEWLIGKGKALDPEKYFIIIPNMFGNGLSSSPSNMRGDLRGARFPEITIYDNVIAQYRLVTEQFGISKIKLITGWSLAAMQTFHWAVAFPAMIEKIAPFGGASHGPAQFKIIYNAVKNALKTDCEWNEGEYKQNPEKGLRAMAQTYCPWGYSFAFFHEKLYLKDPEISSVEDFVEKNWEKAFLQLDANDLLAMLETGQKGNVGNLAPFKGDHLKALKSIKAQTLIMSGSMDLLFPKEVNEEEAQYISGAKMVVVDSKAGHEFGIGFHEQENIFIDQQLKAFLAK